MVEIRKRPGRRAKIVSNVYMVCGNCGFRQIENLHRNEVITDGEKVRKVDDDLLPEPIVCRNCHATCKFQVVDRKPVERKEEWDETVEN